MDKISDVFGDGPIWKHTIWVSDEELAIALLSRDHALYSTFYEEQHGSINWLFVYDDNILPDIYNFENVELSVNAHAHYDIMLGASDAFGKTRQVNGGK